MITQHRRLGYLVYAVLVAGVTFAPSDALAAALACVLFAWCVSPFMWLSGEADDARALGEWLGGACARRSARR